VAHLGHLYFSFCFNPQSGVPISDLELLFSWFQKKEEDETSKKVCSLNAFLEEGEQKD
jgi:hypothetical protein